MGQVHPAAAQGQRQLRNQRGRQRLTMQHSPLQVGDGKLHRYGHILLHPQVERASNQGRIGHCLRREAVGGGPPGRHHNSHHGWVGRGIIVVDQPLAVVGQPGQRSTVEGLIRLGRARLRTE